MHFALPFTLLLSLSLLPIQNSLAQSATSSDNSLSGGAVQQVIEQQNQIINRLKQTIQQLEKRMSRLESARFEAASIQETQTPGKENLPDISEQEHREQERLVRTAFQQTLIDRSGLLLPAGMMDLAPSLKYSHSSADNIVIDGFTIFPVLVVGDIVSERIKRNQATAAVTARIGLPWDSQLDIHIPYGYSEVRKFSADNNDTTTSTHGLGDITIGLSHQLLYGSGGSPDILGSLRWKTTSGRGPFDTSVSNPIATGSGYDSVNLGFTGVKVVDPLVYFGGINYSWNQSTNEVAGHFNPGNSVGFSLGIAIALNLTGSLSFVYDQQFTERSELDDEPIPGSYLTTGVFSIGGSFAISDTKTADVSLGIGVTEDSPDAQIGVSMPIRFR